MEQRQVSVQPGGEARLTLRLMNPTDVVDIFDVTIVGPAAPHATVAPTEVHLFPQQSGDVAVTVKLPPNTPLSGPVAIGIKVSSRDNPRDSVVEEATLHVGGVTRITVAVKPRRVEGKLKSRHRVVITNGGNQTTAVELSGSDPDDLLALRFWPDKLVIGAGATAEASVEVTAREFTAGSERPFQVFARVPGEEAVAISDGSLAQRRGRSTPGWLMPVAALAVGVVVAAAILISRGGGGGGKSSQSSQLAGNGAATTTTGSTTTSTTAPATSTTTTPTVTMPPGGGGTRMVPFVHIANAGNSTGDHTFIDNPAVNGNENAVIVVTANWNAPGAQQFYDTANLGVSFLNGKWAVMHEDNSPIPPGTGYNINAYAAPSIQTFVHTASATNSTNNFTTIDSPATNGNPNAIVLVTPNWSPPGGQHVNDKAPLGVFFQSGTWRIFHQDKTPVPAGAAYNVHVYGVATQSFIHTASSSNSAGDYTTIDNQVINGKPDAILVITPNFSPPGGQHVFDPATLGVFYANGKWAIFHEDKTAVPAGAAYNIAVAL